MTTASILFGFSIERTAYPLLSELYCYIIVAALRCTNKPMPQKVFSIRPQFRSPTSAAPRYDGGTLADMRGRPLRDLRISVTDRCNFRCTYCMPREVFDSSYRFLPHNAILSFEEIARLARIFVGLGVTKIRLTGGEPLLRKDLPALIAMLAPLGAELTLTTNGSTLVKHAAALKAAGLDRLTVSLDSLDEATFRAMNDVDFPVGKVLEGIAAAASAGFEAIKLNMVVKRGVNDHQLVDTARYWREAGRGAGHILRFIEFMDVGSTNGWRMDDVVPSAEVVHRIGQVFALEPTEPNYLGEVAERWRYADGTGEIGVISSVTQAFCRDCSRMRLSTEGSLFTCLFAQQGHDLKSLLRGGAHDDAIRDSIAAVWRGRDDRYSENRTAQTAALRKVEMSYIGG
jgi:cyclic pyranopterin phosphate synthase